MNAHPFRPSRDAVHSGSILLCAAILAGCSSPVQREAGASAPTAAPSTTLSAAAQLMARLARPGAEGGNWTYPELTANRTGMVNNWVNANNPDCASNVAGQSPIALDPGQVQPSGTTKLPSGLSDPKFNVTLTSPASASHANYSFAVPPGGPTLNGSNAGDVWTPVSFHVHAGIEHVVRDSAALPIPQYGPTSPLAVELHVIATAKDGQTGPKFAVFGFQFISDASGDALLLGPIAQTITNTRAGTESTATFALGNLLQRITQQAAFTYGGGLTTPGCNPNTVQWWVLKDPIKADALTMASLVAGLYNVTNPNLSLPNVRTLQSAPSVVQLISP